MEAKKGGGGGTKAKGGPARGNGQQGSPKGGKKRSFDAGFQAKSGSGGSKKSQDQLVKGVKPKKIKFDDDGSSKKESAGSLIAKPASGEKKEKQGKKRSIGETSESGADEKGAKVKKGMKHKKRKIERKKHEEKNFEVLTEVKKLWEISRKKDKKIKKEDRQETIEKLLELCKGKMLEIIFKHDGSRIIQTIYQYGTKEQRDVVLAELAGHVVELSKAIYSRFLITKMLHYSTKEQQEQIIKEFYGRVRRLIRHREAAVVIEYAYSEIANKRQRVALVSEFYGPNFSLFESGQRTLEEVIKAQPDQKEYIVSHMSEVVSGVVDKHILNHSIVHRLLLDYLQYASPNSKKEVLSNIKEDLIQMRATREGSQVAVQAVAYGSPKDRKAIIKTLKGMVVEMAQEDYGHLLLLSIMDVTDDTVLVTKGLLNELLKAGDEEFLALVNHKVAKSIFLHVLAPRDTKYFTADALKTLAPVTIVDPTTGEEQATSKKEPEVRRKQLLEGVLPPLLGLFSSSAEVLKAVMTSPNGSQVLLQTLLNADATQREPIYSVLAELVKGVEEDNVVDHFLVSRDLKRLLKNDVTLGGVLFGSLKGNLRHWVEKKGAAFVVAALLESEDKELAAKVAAELKPHLKAIEGLQNPGAKVVAKALGSKKASSS